MKNLWRNAMPSKQERFRIAVFDDYQNVALSLANWSVLDGRTTVTVFNDHLADPEAVVERLRPFDIVWSRQRRRRGGADRQRLWNESDRLEPESHGRARGRSERYAGHKGRAVPTGGCRLERLSRDESTCR
jgi:hypothetical protein